MIGLKYSTQTISKKDVSDVSKVLKSEFLILGDEIFSLLLFLYEKRMCPKLIKHIAKGFLQRY